MARRCEIEFSHRAFANPFLGHAVGVTACGEYRVRRSIEGRCNTTMSSTRLTIAILLQHTFVVSPWGGERWAPIAIEIVANAAGAEPTPTVEASKRAGVSNGGGERAAATRVACGSGTCWRFADYALELHRSEGEGYYLNLTSPEPKVFVMWRMLEAESMSADGPAARPEIATVSYHEAARMLDGGEQVDAVPMPVQVRAWMTPFVAQHYKPEPRRKVRRRDPLRDGGSSGSVRGEFSRFDADDMHR